jgi:hypothetical protein
MTEKQYESAIADLVARVQAMREFESGASALIPGVQGSGGAHDIDSLDDDFTLPLLSEQQAANNKWVQYCRLVKNGRNFPKKFQKEGLVVIGEITFGVVEEPGEDLIASMPFKRCNLADFIDKEGYFDLVKFLGFNRQSFPFLYKLACCLASMRTNEVGCERLSWICFESKKNES